MKHLFTLFLVVAGLFSLNAQVIETTQTDEITNDNGNNKADAGEIIRYKATILNTDEVDGDNVQLAVTPDPRTAFVLGSFLTTPIAANDGYTATGNVPISVPANSGLLQNDFDDDLANLTVDVTTPTFATNQNGSVTLQADGSFDYTPPAGFTGADNFTYTLVDNTPIPDCAPRNMDITATVVIVVSNMLWFVDNSSGAATSDGRLNTPFKTLADFNSNSAIAGDVIYIEATGTDYSGGITLQDNERLFGEGHTGGTNLEDVLNFTLATHSVMLPNINSTRPVLTGTGISLAVANTIRGLNVGDTGNNTGLVGTNVGNLTISEMSILGTGKAVDINGGGTLDVDFDAVTTTSSTSTGVSLQSVGGTTDFGALNISGTTGTAFFVSNAGTVNSSSGTINGGNQTAIDIDNTTLGMTLTSVSSSGGSTTGIDLQNTNGPFAVEGSGTTNGSGGTISNKLNVDATVFNTTNGAITLKNMIIEDINASGDASDAIGTRTGVDGIHGANVNGGLILDNVILRRFSDNAIVGGTFAVTPLETTWNGLQILNSTIELANRFHVANRGDSSDEGIIKIDGLTGTVIVNNSTIQNGARGMELSTPSSAGTLDMTVQRSNFSQIYKAFQTGGTVNIGLRGISLIAEGTHDVVVRIGDPAETNATLGNIFTNNATASIVVAGQSGGGTPHTGDIDVVISRNQFIINDHKTPQSTAPDLTSFNFPQGGVALNPHGGNFEAIVSHNLFDEVMHAAGGLGQLTIGHNGDQSAMGAAGEGHSEFIIRNNTFQLPWDAALQLRAEDNASMAVLLENNTWTAGFVGGTGTDLEGVTGCGLGSPNDFCPSPFQGVLVNVRSNGSMDLTIQNEALLQHDTDNSPTSNTLMVEVQNDVGNILDLFLQNNSAPAGYSLTHSNGTFNLFRNGSGAGTAAGVVDDNNNTGGGNNAATDPPTVVTSGTITLSNTAPTLPMITIN